MKLDSALAAEFNSRQRGDSGSSRRDFDMNDQPELQAGLFADAPQLQRALEYLQSTVYQAWIDSDRRATGSERSHRRLTRLAIWPGTMAVLLAISMLVFSNIRPAWSGALLPLELISVVLAAVAVSLGLRLHFHHAWIAHRQAAERLRSLKFEALAWDLAWTDPPAWQAAVTAATERLKNLDVAAAEHWATESDDVHPWSTQATEPELARPAGVALADYYRWKRLEYQRRFFEQEAARADASSFPRRFKLSLICFFGSVGIVLLHGLLSLWNATAEPSALPAPGATSGHAEHTAWHQAEILLIGLGALLPVLGMGFRAWESAFESVRSRNLFRAKAHALAQPIAQLSAWSEPAQASPASPASSRALFETIRFSEYFFRNEHREWCRLQTEAEWYF